MCCSDSCWIKRISEFLKVSKACEYTDDENNNYASCEKFSEDNVGSGYNAISYSYADKLPIYQLADGMVVSSILEQANFNCNINVGTNVNDVCVQQFVIDVNGPNKGKNSIEDEQFVFAISDSLGVIPNPFNSGYHACVIYKAGYYCTSWVLNFGNLDYKKN